MSELRATRKLIWLRSMLRVKRDELVNFFHINSTFTAPASLRPSIFRRLIENLEEIASSIDKELRIISLIEATERKHQALRRMHSLREVPPTPAANNDATPPSKSVQNSVPLPQEAKRPDDSFWWLLALWYLLSGQKLKHK